MLKSIRWKSLRFKIIVWTFVPTAIIMAAVTLVTFAAYRQVTEDLIIARNQEVTRLAAIQFATDLAGYAELLDTEAHREDFSRHGTDAQLAALKNSQNRLSIFDGGVLVLDTFGQVAAAEPLRPDALGQDWSDRSYYRQMISDPGPKYSNIVSNGPDGSEVIVVAVPIRGDQDQLLGVMAGMFRLDAATSAFYGDIVRQRIGVEGNSILVDGTGRVIYHTDLIKIGDDFSTQEEVLQVLQEQTGAMISVGETGEEIVASFAPVPGTSWGLVAQENWRALIRPNRGFQNALLLLLAFGIVIPALVVAWGVRRITMPIKELGQTAQEVAKGNFGHTISTQTGDEIEELADQFNLMSGQLQQSYTQLEQQVADRTKELAVLNAIAATVNKSSSLEQILNDALDEALRVMNIDTGGIYLLDEINQVLIIEAQRGFKPEYIDQINNLEIGEGFSGKVIQSGQTLVINDVSTDPRLTRMILREEGLRSMAVMPISSKEKVIGTLFTITHDNRDFSPQDLQLLSSIAYQIGVAVENTHLFTQSRQVTIMDERNRLARDLHDSVTQSIYSLTLLSEAGQRMIKKGDIAQAEENQARLGAIAQQALQEMRLLVYELRPLVLQTEGLVGALEHRLASVERRAGLNARINADQGLDVPQSIEEEIYHIATEALNNVLKHAAASEINLSFSSEDGSLLMRIEDNGRGFDPDSALNQGGIGLSSMIERVEKIGGMISIQSEPDQGTVLNVRIPLDQQGNT